jgi:hypothetical protein
VEAQASERNRLQRLLETCNVKLASVASDVFGKSGREILRALIRGEASPEEMSRLARGRLRHKLDALVMALHGKVEAHHRFMLEMQLGRVEDIEANIAVVDRKIDEAVEPYREIVECLKTIPGVDRVGAITIIAELGVDMSVFPTVAHAAAWAGVCPGNNESAGKRMEQQKRRGNVHICSALVQAAMAASKTKNTYFKARFWKIAGRAGKKRAAVAIAHSILKAVYQMLKAGIKYKDLGGDYLDRLLNRSAEKRLIQRLRSMVTRCVRRPHDSKGFLHVFMTARGRSPLFENRSMNLKNLAETLCGFVPFCHGQLNSTYWKESLCSSGMKNGGYVAASA